MARSITPVITRTPVTSSDLAEVGYDAKTQTLEVLFHRGGVYRYFAVPPAVYEELMSAPSIGRYFAWHIKRGGAYRYERMASHG